MKKRAIEKPKKTAVKKKPSSEPGAPAIHPTENVAIASLRPHPENYRGHPEKQVAEIAESIRQHGIYKNIVVARDGTILAGHGLVLGAEKLGMKILPVVRIPIAPDHPRALKIVAADNTIPRLAEDDPKGLAEMLRKIREEDEAGLLGTGYDDIALDRLLASDADAVDANEEWTGMPEFDQQDKEALQKIVLNFKTREDVEAFAKLIEQPISEKTRSLWYPKVEIERLMDKRYRREDAGEVATE